MKKIRAASLDVFRGVTIFGMILTGSISSRVLPAWMYHAQVGPRSKFAFDPSIYGITWVDLIFPFFLFAMGAAFPFSMRGKLERGVSKMSLAADALKRGARLTFFAIFIQHLYPWNTFPGNPLGSRLAALLAFVLLFVMFLRIPGKLNSYIRTGIEFAGYGLGVLLLVNTPYNNEASFSLYQSNIIILLLANMAVFGMLIYLFTIDKPLHRLAVLPLLMGVYLSSKTEGSWAQAVFNHSLIPWFYGFGYLKYLFIVIPATLAGEYLRSWLKSSESLEDVIARKKAPFVLVLTISLLLLNLLGLYMRSLTLNLFGTLALLLLLWYVLRGEGRFMNYWKQLFSIGAFLLVLGLCFEAFEGGIRKDHATYSYYFVTSGLAFLMMISFSIVCDLYQWRIIAKPLQYTGQNPMIAYVAPHLFVNPILYLLGISPYLAMLDSNSWTGLLKGLLITLLSVGVAIFFSKKRWFWRT